MMSRITRGESYEFLIRNATIMVEFYTRGIALPSSKHDTEKQAKYHLREKEEHLAKWKAALELLESEKEFHLNLFERKEKKEKVNGA
jgi:hypothetical protein